MKIHDYKESAIFTILVALLFAFSGCSSDGSGGKEVSSSAKLNAERPTAHTLVTEEMVRRVFRVEETIPITIENSSNSALSCTWEMSRGGEAMERYQVDFSFAQDQPLGIEGTETAWVEQERTLYADYGILVVQGVGKRATWTDLNGGQLRVDTEKDIFFVSPSSSLINGDEQSDIWDVQYKMNKSMFLAKEVMQKLD